MRKIWILALVLFVISMNASAANYYVYYIMFQGNDWSRGGGPFSTYSECQEHRLDAYVSWAYQSVCSETRP